MRKIIVLLAMVLLTLPVLAQDGIVIGGDETQLRAFLTRLIERNVGYYPFEEESPRVYVGELLPEMPFELKLPPQATLIGTIDNTGPYSGDEIYFTTDLEPEDLMTFLDTTLPDGFAEPEGVETERMMSGPGGFAAPEISIGKMYCYNEDEGALMLQARWKPDTAETDAMLMWMTPAMADICHMDRAAMSMPRGAFGMIPNLATPEGVRVKRASGGGGSDFDASSGALIISEEMNAEALLIHYNGQLEAAGWALAESSSEPMGAWSTWTKTSDEGDEYSAWLQIIASPVEESTYNANVTVSRVGF